ncbi:MAG: hypothetical protein ACM3O9_03525 [Methylocystaceae bacterium]
MATEIKLNFHHQGLRSYIEVDLCAHCPRQDDKGCCGYYSPVFYPLDLYYLQQNAPQVLDIIWSLPHLTILDHSVTVNSFPDETGGYYCQFHRREGGCQLKQEWRESVCRHFVCPGINWQEEDSLSDWCEIFDSLENLEIKLNQVITDHLANANLSLRDPQQRDKWLTELAEVVPLVTSRVNGSIFGPPLQNEVTIKRELKYGSMWPL